MKKLLLAALLCLPGLAWAGSVDSASFNIQYRLDATTATYCVVKGKAGDPFRGSIPGPSTITTSGSSTTTTEGVASAAPFTLLAVGDVISVSSPDGTTANRVITAKASGSSITVDTAWDLSTAVPFSWWDVTCGTTASDGWIDVAGADRVAITFEIDQLNVTGGIDMQIQCRASGISSSPVQVFPTCSSGSCATVQNYTTAGIASSTTVVLEVPYSTCRVGIFIHTSDDGGDLTTNEELIDVSIMKYFLSR